MPAAPLNPMSTLLGTDVLSDPVNSGWMEKLNQNAERRHWATIPQPNKTAAYTVDLTDSLIFTDTATVGAFTITLPPAADAVGMVVTFKQISTGTAVCTIEPDDVAETIDGATSNTSLNAQYDVLTLACDGALWHVLYQT